MRDDAPLAFTYHFVFEDGDQVEITARLDPVTLALLKAPPGHPPEWTRLSSVCCSVCELQADMGGICPVAANLAELIDRFGSRFSYEKVSLRVITPERFVSGQTTLQQALSSLTGIYMVSAGCPTLDKLRPMVRFHLPLASLDETIYRATSMYLFGQYLRAQRGLEPDWTLAGLEEIYSRIHRVNLGIARCIREAAEHDASANALVRLDLFADGVSFSIRDALKEFDYLFALTYLDKT